MALPHITNSLAGRDRLDPAYKNIFEVYFTLPEALRAEFGQDEALITEHVTEISGLNALDKEPGKDVQKFMGTTRTYLKSKLDDTSAEITVKFTLNLRNGVDNYIYKLFKAWGKLNYDISTGEKSLKKDYCADWLRISVGNRAGEIYREIVFKDVIMFDPIEMTDTYSYDEEGVCDLTVKFASDWWDESNL